MSEPTGSALTDALVALGDARVLVVSETNTIVEREILERSIDQDDPRIEHIDARDPDLEAKLQIDDLTLLPVRVVWLPSERGGRHRLGLTDVLRLENPRRPRPRTQSKLVAASSERLRVVVGESATVDDVRRRWRDETAGRGGAAGFVEFARRRAVLALERAERDLLGGRYKVPKLVSEEIRDSARFQAHVTELAAELGRSRADVHAEVSDALDQVVASQSKLATDLFDAAFAPMYDRAWELDVDTDALERLREINQDHALAFLPAHRSYADPLILSRVLHDASFPRNHTPGGRNLSFWPVGPLARRAGVIYIPRTLQGDDATKLALREYLGFLAAKRFNLEWYMEAGRSRTGKLRPPRFGILQYVVEALRDGRFDDIALVPVSLTYDRLPEIASMAAEEQGATKQAEGVAWLARYIKTNSKMLGTAFVRFGEPMSLRESLDAAAEQGAGHRLAMQKVGFEVFHRINQVTPITPMAVVTMALLGVDGRALTEDEVAELVAAFVDYLDARGLALTDRGAVVEPAGLARTLAALEAEGIVTRHGTGADAVVLIEPGQHHSAAFYRNSGIHWFINRAVIETATALALDEPGEDPVAAAWQHCLGLRDLLKFEFFFSSKRAFYEELLEERALLGITADEDLPADHESARGLLEGADFFATPIVLRPFVEAYSVVARYLADLDPRTPLVEQDVVDACADLGRRLLLQHRLHNPESVSRELFSSALQLVRNRDLYDPGRSEVADGRRALADEVDRVLAAIDEIDRIDRDRQAGVRPASRHHVTSAPAR